MNIKDLQHKNAPKPDRLQKTGSPSLPVDKIVSIQPSEYEYFLNCMRATITAYEVLSIKRTGKGY